MVLTIPNILFKFKREIKAQIGKLDKIKQMVSYLLDFMSHSGGSAKK